MLGRTILALILFLSLSFAIDLQYPNVQNIKTGDVVDLGTIGPGQTVSIDINRNVSTGGIYGIGGLYTRAVVSDIPRGWTSSDSKLYANPLQITITAAPYAAEGNYTSLVTVVDDNTAEGLQNITFTAKIRVTYDVMSFNVSPTYIDVGPGQPARFAITITNKGSASDVFQVSANGSKRWEFQKSVYVPAYSTRTIYYEIVGQEEENYTTAINVASLASNIISSQQNVTLYIHSNLLGDYSATNNGLLVFPIFEAPIYSLAGILSNFFPH